MALYIKQDDGSQWYEWHTGEPIPPITSRVVIFQADGDELTMILAAMNAKLIVPRDVVTSEEQLQQASLALIRRLNYGEISTDVLDPLRDEIQGVVKLLTKAGLVNQ